MNEKEAINNMAQSMRLINALNVIEKNKFNLFPRLSILIISCENIIRCTLEMIGKNYPTDLHKHAIDKLFDHLCSNSNIVGYQENSFPNKKYYYDIKMGNQRYDIDKAINYHNNLIELSFDLIKSIKLSSGNVDDIFKCNKDSIKYIVFNCNESIYLHRILLGPTYMECIDIIGNVDKFDMFKSFSIANSGLILRIEGLEMIIMEVLDIVCKNDKRKYQPKHDIRALIIKIYTKKQVNFDKFITYDNIDKLPDSKDYTGLRFAIIEKEIAIDTDKRLRNTALALFEFLKAEIISSSDTL